MNFSLNFEKSNKMESLNQSLKSYTYIANYLVTKISNLEKKQSQSRKSYKKEINDLKRQLKKAEIEIAFLSNDIMLLN